MTNVTKERNWGASDVINVQTESGNFYISFEKDLNLYFSYLGNNVEDEKDKYSFVIDQDNEFLYEQFDNLYDAIIGQKPYKYSENLNSDFYYSLDKLSEKLVDDGEINWHSDDSDYDTASVLSVKKRNNSFLVTFKKGQNDEFSRTTYKVCIKNGGSRYDPYNTSFMIFYNNLNEHDFELDKNISKVKVRTR